MDQRSQFCVAGGEAVGSRPAPRMLLGTVLLSSASIVKLALQLVLIPVLARLLGPQVFGVMGIAMSFVLLANVLSDGGMGAALIRETEADIALESTIYWLSVIIGVALAAAVAIAAWPMALIYRQSELAPVMWALSPILFLSSILSVANARIVRDQRFHLFAASDVACALLSAAVGLALAFRGYGIWSLVAQQLTLWTAKTVFVTWAAHFRPKPVLDIRKARPLFRFSANNLAASIADFAGKNAPILIVGAVLGAGAVARYTMAYQLTRVAELVVSNPVNLAAFSAVAIAANRQAATALTLTGLRIMNLVLMPAFCGLALTADLLAPIVLGPRWSGTALALAVLAPGAFFLCVYSFATAALLGIGRAGRVLKLTVLTGIATAIGTVIGVRHGVGWAIAGFSIGAAAIAPFYIRALSGAMHIAWPRLLGTGRTALLAAAAMSASVLILREHIAGLLPIVQLILSAVLGGLVCVACAGLLDAKQIRADLKKLRRQTPEDASSVPAAWPFLPQPNEAKSLSPNPVETARCDPAL